MVGKDKYQVGHDPAGYDDKEYLKKLFDSSKSSNIAFNELKFKFYVHEAHRNATLLQIEPFYKSLIEIDQKNPSFHETFAFFQTAMMDNSDKAEELYLDVLRYYPNSVSFISNVGKFYLVNGEEAKAREYFDKALEIEPNYAKIFYYFAMIEKIKQNKEDSKKWFEKALETDPNLVVAHMNYANLLQTKFSDFDGAKKHYLEAIRSDPNHANARGAFGELLFDEKNFDEAKVQFEEFLRGHPNHPAGNYIRERLAAANEKLR